MKNIIIVGAGGIGKACALILLQHDKSNDLAISLADIDYTQCEKAIQWINNGLENPRKLECIDLSKTQPEKWNPEGEIILDCTPGIHAEEIAKIALRNNMHYANLTEHVPATNAILKLVKDNSKCFALQTGLAPGFVNVWTKKLISDFKTELHESKIKTVKMRVGALSPTVSSPSFYAFTWSPIGVSTEYLNKAIILKNKEIISVEALSGREDIIINGIHYEAEHTSGGASDLPQYYANEVDNLDYKTIRYPGHFDWVKKVKSQIGKNITPELLKSKMIREIPFQETDRVIIYTSITGLQSNKTILEKCKVIEIRPITYNSIEMAAIQRTTAASLAQTAMLLLTNKYSGCMLQSQFPTEKFLGGEIIKEHYGTFTS